MSNRWPHVPATRSHRGGFASGPRVAVAVAAVVAFVSLGAPASEPRVGGGRTSLESVSSEGVQGNDYSNLPSLSRDGDTLAFCSYASNLVEADANGADVFIRRRSDGLTVRASVASGGVEANHSSCFPALSADGRFVAFISKATNLAPADVSVNEDIYLHDLERGTTRLVSVGLDGAQPNSWSFSPSVSADGRYVAFHSKASNLVIGDTNGVVDVFVRDMRRGVTERVSVSSSESQANGSNSAAYGSVISDDGRYVIFFSYADNLVEGYNRGAYVRDRRLGRTFLVSLDSDENSLPGSPYWVAISGDGRFAAIAQAEPALRLGDSAGLNWITGIANPQIDVHVRDLALGTTELVSRSSLGQRGLISSPVVTISEDGRLVAFASVSPNLVAADEKSDYDVFVHDRLTGQTSLVSQSSAGIPGTGESGWPSISGDGRYIAFASEAMNLTTDDRALCPDTSALTCPDIFVRDRGPVTCPSGRRPDGSVSTLIAALAHLRTETSDLACAIVDAGV